MRLHYNNGNLTSTQDDSCSITYNKNGTTTQSKYKSGRYDSHEVMQRFFFNKNIIYLASRCEDHIEVKMRFRDNNEFETTAIYDLDGELQSFDTFNLTIAQPELDLFERCMLYNEIDTDSLLTEYSENC